MVAVTMGDPVGIGPEVSLKGFTPSPRRIHIGDPEVYRRTAAHLGLKRMFQEVNSVEEAAPLAAEIFAILPTHNRVDWSASIPFGRVNPQHAAATIESIRTACQLALAQRVQAVVTPPINKAVWHAAHFHYPGHTELLAQCTGVDHAVMMLAGEGLRVVPTTIHQSLITVPQTLTRALLQRTLEITYAALRQDFAISQPRIVVAGLNPHAGEMGSFGHEEVEMIAPLIHDLSERWPGVILGPVAADSLFHREARKTYDAVVCMYHDQALIPIKMLAFGRSVNITLGLPIVRTSVDHGTAYPIAGQGVADPGSLMHAVTMAMQLAENRGTVFLN